MNKSIEHLTFNILFNPLYTSMNYKTILNKYSTLHIYTYGILIHEYIVCFVLWLFLHNKCIKKKGSLWTFYGWPILFESNNKNGSKNFFMFKKLI